MADSSQLEVKCPVCKGTHLVPLDGLGRGSFSCPDDADRAMNVRVPPEEWRRVVTTLGDSTKELEALCAEYARQLEEAHKALQDWRQWAQFVYLGGGPVEKTDEELRAAVCAAQDADVEAARSAADDADERSGRYDYD